MEGTAGKLIAAFVLIIIGAVMIGSIATNTLAVTDKRQASETFSLAGIRAPGGDLNRNVSINLTYKPTTWKRTDCPISDFALTNASGTLMTENTDYILNPVEGNFTVIPTGLNTGLNLTSSNTTTAAYHYCGDDYLNSNFGRTVENLVPGFFALAILGAGLLFLYSVMKDWDFF